MALFRGDFHPKSLMVVAFTLVVFGGAGAVPTGAADITVSWASNPESDLQGYRLRYGTASGLYTRTLEAGEATATVVSGLDSDQTYYFTVYAYDVAGNESAPSAEVKARVPASEAIVPRVEQTVDLGSNSIYAVRSRSHLLKISGQNFQANATIEMGDGVVVGKPTLNASGDLVVLATIATGALLGPHTVTVINPDQGTGGRTDSLHVIRTPDTNVDCAVDIVDLNALARAWNEAAGEGRYIEEADLDGDEYIGPNDLTIFVKFMGRQFYGCS